MLLRPCPTWSLMDHFFFMSFHFLLFYLFTTVKNWLRESTITFKYAQQATTTAHTFISSFCCDIFYFSELLSKFEDSRLWHPDHCKKIARGKAQPHWRQATTTKWRQHKLFFLFFSLFVTLSEEKWKKWKKDDVHSKPQRQPIRIQNLDKWRHMFAHFFTILHFSDFLSKIEQDWPGPTNTFLVSRAILSKIEQDLRGPTNTFFFVLGAFLSKLIKGQLGVPPTVVINHHK